ncbi:MAG TPA: glycoside hydrolase family 28 protein [Verrucomicrobiota bacterium]|nr:glycoside hydrolase family 28 protein [Verrucomicrobiota bacterium]HPU55666.1 glycoside hydrolase family 28 protein [Verrucomicrobiota bacterium]
MNTLFLRTRLISRTVIAFAVVLAATSCTHLRPGGSAKTSDIGWDAVPGILGRIQPPIFPKREFDITEFGAKGDGVTDCTEAIRKAIDACHEAGGGRVLVKSGTFLTGAIHLRSNVDLHVAEGATLKFSPDPAKYLPVVRTRFEGTECMNYSPLIYAFEQENIAITGKGTLDGSASWENWWSWVTTNVPASLRASGRRLLEMADAGVPVEERVFGPGHGLRPSFIQPYRCRNILIEGVFITNSPMWEINPVLSTNIIVRGVTVVSHGPNNDGCNPDSSRDVLIENCVFDTGDDCIAIKSGKNADGRRVGVPSENIVIRNCMMKDGHGGVVLGSEVSGGVRNVFAENCRMDSPNLDRALRLKTNGERGGSIENIFFRNVQVGRVAHSVLTIDLVYGRVPGGPFPPVVRNVVMENVTAASSPRALWIVGTTNSIIENVRIENCEFRGVEGPDVLTRSGSVLLKNVTVQPR